MTLEHTTMLAEEADTLNKFRAVNHAQMVESVNHQTEQNKAITEVFNERLGRTIGNIIKKNDKNYYQGGLRYIFTQWAAFVARQKAFALAIEKVITKSAYANGFSHINAFSKDKQLTR